MGMDSNSVSCVVLNEVLALLKVYSTELKIMFENLPIIKLKAAEKKVAHHGWATRKYFRNENFESVWTRWQKICIKPFFSKEKN